MNEQNSFVHDFVTLRMISADADYFLKLTELLRVTPAAGVLVLGCYPYYCLFCIEADTFLRDRSAVYTECSKQIEHKTFLRAARHRTKLLGGSVDPISSLLEIRANIAQWNQNHFIDSHTGTLSWLKKMLSSDLGLYFGGGHLIGSTFDAIYNLSIDEEEAEEYRGQGFPGITKLIGESSIELGKWTGLIHSVTELVPSIEADIGIHFPQNSTYYERADTVATHYLAKLFGHDVSSDVSSVLMMLLTKANFIRYFFHDPTSPIHEASFKIRYVTLYNIVHCLQTLRSYSANKNLLSNDAIARVNAILKSRELKELVKRGEKFRNILVHYSLRERSKVIVSASNLDLDSPLCGLASFFFPKYSFEELNHMVFIELSRVADSLEEWFLLTSGMDVRMQRIDS